MKQYISIWVSAILIITGCCKDNDIPVIVESEESQAPIFKAGFDCDMTRTFIDGNVIMRWNTLDEISVFYNSTFNRRYHFNGNSGDIEGTFSQNTPDETLIEEEIATNYAIYPYSKSTVISDDGTISITLPETQNYARNSFGPLANTMLAVTKNKDDCYLPFKNLCGYLKLKLYGDVTVKSIILQGTDREPIAGKATVKAEYGKSPGIVMGKEATSVILLDCGEGVKTGETEDCATEFWIVVPPTRFKNGFTVSVIGIDGGECCRVTTKEHFIERNKILSMEATVSSTKEYTVPAGNTIWYTTTDDEVIKINPDRFDSEIISNRYENGMGTITFADEITKIPKDAFYYNTNLTSIVISNSITSIGEYAFYNCNNLTSINMPWFLAEIGRDAFNGCNSLKGDIEIPSGVKKINFMTFHECRNLTSLVLPSSITEIEGYAFEGCGGELTVNCNILNSSYRDGCFYKSEFTKVTIGEGVKTIGNDAFNQCSTITSLTLPSTLTEIGSSAFYGCSGLTGEIEIPEGVTVINYDTFQECSNLSHIKISGSVTEIGSSAFDGCRSLTNINIPDTVTEIGPYAFNGCSSLVGEVEIPEGVTVINYNTFQGCSNLSHIKISGSVTEIGSSAFDGCSSLTNINIPDTVTEIGSSAFNGCSSLVGEVEIPHGVREIYQRTFYGCKNLTRLIIPSSITGIAAGAFEGCGGELIVNCNIPDGKDNKTSAFAEADFTKVTIGEGVEKIGRYAFCTCDSIIDATIPSSVIEIGRNAFCRISGNLTIKCNLPKNGYSDRWCENCDFNNVTISHGVTSIGENAFYGCRNIRHITIPGSITSIGSNAFSDCGGELEVNCNIPASAFNGARFTKVKIGEGVTTIGEDAFRYNFDLLEVSTPSTMTEIGKQAFYYCSTLHAMYCTAATPPELGKDVFRYHNSDFKIYVPISSITAYKSDWYEYSDLIEGIQ